MSTERNKPALQELFQETEIKDINLANRFIYSAIWEGLADDNCR